MTSDIAATVVVPTRDRPELLRETLRALLNTPLPGMRVLVVDQSAGRASRDIVEALAATDARVSHLGTSTVGLSASRNVGASAATTAYVAYLDDDCIVTDTWLPELVRELSSSGAAGVFGKLLPYEGGPRTGTEVGFKATPFREEFVGWTPPWHIGHGGSMAFRRDALIDAGGFDPLLGAGGTLGANEDGDMAYRLLRRGHRLVYCPAAVAYHRHWKPWRSQQAMERAYGLGAGGSFAKYVRCGDLGGVRLFAAWWWQLGVRRFVAGLLKWRDPKVMYLGYCQLVYPFIGAWRSLRHAVDRRATTYAASGASSGLGHDLQTLAGVIAIASLPLAYCVEVIVQR